MYTAHRLACVVVALCCLALIAAQPAPKEVTVSGKVLDADSGKPLQGISLSMFYSAENAGGRLTSLVTDANGVFKASVPPDAYVLLAPTSTIDYLLDAEWLEANGFSNTAMRLSDENRPSEVIFKVKLLPVCALKGTVALPDGKPAANAILTTGLGAGQFSTGEGTIVRADAQGRFIIKNAPAARDYQLLAVSANQAAGIVTSVKAGTTSCDISLAPAAVIEGEITFEDGKPLTGEFMAFAALTVNGNSVNLPALRAERLTVPAGMIQAANGRYKIAGTFKDALYQVNWYDGNDYNAGSCTLTAGAAAPKIAVSRFLDDWQKEGNIAIHDKTRCKQLANYCLDASDNILACDELSNRLLKIAPDDTLLAGWDMPFTPQAVAVREDGSILVTGAGKALLLSAEGKMLRSADLPKGASRATSASCCGKDIFICAQSNTGYSVYRLDDQLQNATMVIKGLRGCCGVMDICARDGKVYVAANADFKVVTYDRDGKQLASFGARINADRNAGFDGCCEPKAVCFDKEGNLYTGESNSPGVKKFKADGTFISSVGKVAGIRGCVRVTVAVSRDGSRAYMLDTGRNIIRCIRQDKPKEGEK